MAGSVESRLLAYVEQHQDRLFTLIGDLVRRPSQNTPPDGAEGACQKYVESVLRGCGWQPDVYDLTQVQGLREHPLFVEGRNYAGRPNVGARRRGSGGGRSLILSGHVDTVPRGSQPWTRDAFGGQVESGRLYGRGSNDMKAGVGINLFVAEAVAALDLDFPGDLIFESVVDEEFGGVNGTLGARLRGYVADAAILSEPSFLRICAGQRGGRTVHITFSSTGGVLSEGNFPAGVVEQVARFLARLPQFAGRRRRIPPHPLYAANPDPVPVSITKIFTAPWGTGEPITIPEECRIEMYWQLMPGEQQADVDREFFEWFEGMMAEAPQLFARRPHVEFPIRWLPGSAISPAEPVVRTLSACAAQITGAPPPVVGIEGPCDLFVFHCFGIPAVLWGPVGGNTHAADEYVDLASVVTAAKSLSLLVARWCAGET
jgi:acetylornithine deacetylase